MRARVLQLLDSASSQLVTYVNNPKNVAPTIAVIPAPPTSQLVEEYISRFWPNTDIVNINNHGQKYWDTYTKM